LSDQISRDGFTVAMTQGDAVILLYVVSLKGASAVALAVTNCLRMLFERLRLQK
jgi:hypothetical protein